MPCHHVDAANVLPRWDTLPWPMLLKDPGPSSPHLPHRGGAAGAQPQGQRFCTRTLEGLSCTKAVSHLIKSRAAVRSLPAHQHGSSGSSVRAEAESQHHYEAGTCPGAGSQDPVTLLLPAKPCLSLCPQTGTLHVGAPEYLSRAFPKGALHFVDSFGLPRRSEGCQR